MNDFVERDAKEVFEEDFLNFAGYNLQRRALPDVRDGLKWGTRKLLHAQEIGKLTYDRPFKKAIKSVSQAMSFSYTHGDASAYGTFIRMAKPFVMNVPLQEANGNYGTLISPDDHSASRYVEMRGSEAAAYLLKDLEKDTITEWEDTYDLEGQFPKVLPAKGLWGLVNGCISIGSGMSCSVPPMNLRELNTALIKLLWNKEAPDNEIIVMPDFPTGGILLNAAEVEESLKKGSGAACKIRSVIEYDANEHCLIVKELPYSTYTNTICNELATLIEEEKVPGIDYFVDYTGKQADFRIFLTKRARPETVLKALYKNTSLQSFFSINMTMLDEGTTPRIFGLRDAMLSYLDHELKVYTRGFKFDLKKIEARIHIINGLMRAYDMIDEVVSTIKSASSAQVANQKLQVLLEIDEVQAKAILDLKLSRLSKIDIAKLKDECEELNREVARITAILNDEVLLKKEVEKGLREVAEKFGNERRTKILNVESEEDEPIEVSQLQIALTDHNNLYITKTSSLYTQKRGSAGTKIKMANGESIISSLSMESDKKLMLFSRNGNAYSCDASALPMDGRISAYEMAQIGDEEICALATANLGTPILFFTKKGFLKKSLMKDYKSVSKKSGVKAISLEEGDEIVSVLFTDNSKVGILTEKGNFLIIETKDVNPIGRIAKGIYAIKLGTGDSVISVKLIPDSTEYLASISKNGYFKKTRISEFSAQGRNTKGGRIQKFGEGDGAADFCPLKTGDSVLVTANKASIKLAESDIPSLSKGTIGVKSIKIKETDKIIKILVQ